MPDMKTDIIEVLKHIKTLCKWTSFGCENTGCVFYDPIGGENPRKHNCCPFIRENIGEEYGILGLPSPSQWSDEQINSMPHDKQMVAWKIYFMYYLIKEEK